jgi:hypothetical protein
MRFLREAERALKRTRNPKVRKLLQNAIKESERHNALAAEVAKHPLFHESGANGYPFRVKASQHNGDGRSALRRALYRVKDSSVQRNYRNMLWYARERRKLESRTCPVCSKPFTPKRRDAVTCSNRCRQAQFRVTRRGKSP